MNFKDIVINEIPQRKTKTVYYNNKSVQLDEFFVNINEGDTMEAFFSRIKEEIECRSLSKDQYYELIGQINTVLWTHIEPDNSQHKMFEKRINKQGERLSEVRGKQPRIDQDRLNEIGRQLKYICDDVVTGIKSYLE